MSQYIDEFRCFVIVIFTHSTMSERESGIRDKRRNLLFPEGFELRMRNRYVGCIRTF